MEQAETISYSIIEQTEILNLARYVLTSVFAGKSISELESGRREVSGAVSCGSVAGVVEVFAGGDTCDACRATRCDGGDGAIGGF